MSHAGINTRYAMVILIAVSALTALVSSGCMHEGTSTSTNANSNPSTASTNANSAPVAARPAVLEAREPESYSVMTTIVVEPTGSAAKTSIPPIEFSFARMGTDRRVSFKLPDPVGMVIYLEKAPLKYLILPSRNQYVEIDSNELGFQLGDVMSPASAIARLKERAQYEELGAATMNGRTAMKYRFKAAADTHTRVGTAQADTIVYVDQETGLPLRSEIETTSTSGAGARIVVATESLQLSPDPAQFEIPSAMKKVTTAEVKQQVQNFINTMRAVAGYLRQQVNTTPPAAGQP